MIGKWIDLSNWFGYLLRFCSLAVIAAAVVQWVEIGASMKKTKVKWPESTPAADSVGGSTAPAKADQKSAGQCKPDQPAAAPDDCGEFQVDFSGGFNSIAGQMVQMKDLEQSLDSRLKNLKAMIARVEEWMLLQMAEGGIQSVNVNGRTLYRRSDFVVSRAGGTDADEFLELIRSAWPEIVKEGFAPSTLKAVVRERMTAAAEAGRAGVQFYCEQTQQFFDPESVAAGAFGDPPTCPDTGHPIAAVVDGIPREIFDRLYIEEKFKLGNRRS